MKLQEKRRSLVAAEAEREKRARADGLAKIMGRLAANIRGNAERRDPAGAPLSCRGVDAQQLSEAEERARWKRDASEAVIAEKEARSRCSAVLKRPAALIDESYGLPAPSGPRLRRYKVKVGTGLDRVGSALVSAAGGCISSSDPLVGVAAADDSLSTGLNQIVGDLVQEGDSNLVSSGSGLAGVDVVVGSSGGVASAPSVASMCPADPVVREATPAEAAAKMSREFESAFLEELELEEAPAGSAVSEGRVAVGSSADAVEVDAPVVAADSASSGGCRVASGVAAVDAAKRSKTASAAEARQALNETRGIGNLHTVGAKGKEVFGWNRAQELRDALRQSRAACSKNESDKAQSMKPQDNINAATKNTERDESSSATGTGSFNPDVVWLCFPCLLKRGSLSPRIENEVQLRKCEECGTCPQGIYKHTY